MELSVRSKFMSEEILEKRRQMIETEKLHINDKITKEVFQRLYNKYGRNLIEKDFACFFLDISDVSYGRLKRGKSLEIVILSYEYVSNEEFKAIREKLIEVYGLKHGEKITYKQLLEMYDKFGDRLSIQIFLEEILGMEKKDLTEMKKDGKPISFEAEPGEFNAFHKKAKKISMHVLNPEYIYEMREILVLEAGLRIGDNISYAQIQELNQQYCPEMPEPLFAQKVIDMSEVQYRALKKTNSENPVNGFVFQNTDIPVEYIHNVQSKMIRKYKLASEQLLNYEGFEKLYEEYGGSLSRKSFAVLVLEISDRSYNWLKSQTDKSVFILGSKKYTDWEMLRERIIRENGFHCEDLINYEQFKEIHQKLDPNESEIVFAEKIFGISKYSFRCMKSLGKSVGIHFKLPSPDEIKKVQKRIMLETEIHSNDKLNYAELERLYNLYGGVLSIRIFATKVLCIEGKRFCELRSDNNAETFAFSNLEISTSEIERIKQRIIKECDLQGQKKLSLEEINDLYNGYGGIIPFSIFVKEVLGIRRESLENLRGKGYNATTACVRSKFNDKEVKELRRYLAEGLPNDEIATKMGVTTSFLRINMKNLISSEEITVFQLLYERVKILKKQGKTIGEIAEELEILEKDVKRMLVKYKKEQEEEKESKKEQRQQKKIDLQEQARKERIERKAERVLDEYEFDEEGIKTVREHITECKKSFEEGEFLREDLDFLKECMIFVQCNCEEIKLFCRICIKFNEYKMASYFISENIDNEDILPEEKINLMKLQESIEYAIKKENALKMLQGGNEDTSQIAEKTGISEVEVIGLKRAWKESGLHIIEGESYREEDPLIE